MAPLPAPSWPEASVSSEEPNPWPCLQGDLSQPPPPGSGRDLHLPRGHPGHPWGLGQTGEQFSFGSFGFLFLGSIFGCQFAKPVSYFMIMYSNSLGGFSSWVLNCPFSEIIKKLSNVLCNCVTAWDFSRRGRTGCAHVSQGTAALSRKHPFKISGALLRLPPMARVVPARELLWH